MHNFNKNPQSCRVLLDKYRQKNETDCISEGELLEFDLPNHISDLTVYNPTKPIVLNNGKYLLGRMEPRNSEDSQIVFFKERNNRWSLAEKAPIFDLQDPFHIENVQGFNILGGVRTFFEKNEKLGYRTVFYRYKNGLSNLFNKNGKIKKPFAVGPKGMKDIRLIQLNSGKIAIFTRPQGGVAGLGQIGYAEADKLSDLQKMIPRAKLIDGQFRHDEWGGANELHLLEDGKVGVLGHIAHYEGDKKHYYAMSFIFDPKNLKAGPLKILTTADDFPYVSPKNSALGKVIFSGGLLRKEDKTADLYVGIGDVRAGKITIRDPFDKN